MRKMELTFLGSGDAFGSGGRLQTCILVDAQESKFLMDCGATVMPAMRRNGVDPNSIDLILLSHLHGDHFGGIPFFILDAQLISKRTQPLTIAGPVGTAARVTALMEAMFPGSSGVQRKFTVEFVKLTPDQQQPVGNLLVTPCRVTHMASGESLGLRILCHDKVIAYTGDCEWSDNLTTLCRNADLVIAEAYSQERAIKYHMHVPTLLDHWPEMNAKRLILTHMSNEILQKAEAIGWECSADGKKFELE